MKKTVPVLLALILTFSMASELFAQGITEARFIRGDANSDGQVDISDAVFILVNLFGSGSFPSCQDTADVNDSGSVDISDAIYLLNYLFTNGQAIPAPTQTCGRDLTEDKISCDAYPQCIPYFASTYGVSSYWAGFVPQFTFYKNGGAYFTGVGTAACQNRNTCGRGFNISVIDPISGQILVVWKNFDVWGYPVGNLMAKYIEDIPDGHLVIVAECDTAISAGNPLSFGEELAVALEKLGSKQIRNIGFRQGWVLIAIKGKGALAEDLGDAPDPWNASASTPVEGPAEDAQGNTLESAAVIEANSNKADYLETGDVDFSKITLKEEGLLIAQNPECCATNVVTELLDERGSLLVSNENPQGIVNSTLAQYLPAGDYYLRMKGGELAGVGSYVSKTFFQPKTDRIVLPARNEPISSSTATFEWISKGETEFFLNIATNKFALESSPDIFHASVGTNTSIQISGIPLNGDPILFRLYSRVNAGPWVPEDFFFMTKNDVAVTAPLKNAVLSEPKLYLEWKKTDDKIARYHLSVGNAWQSFFYNPYGDIFANYVPNTASTAVVPGISLNGMPKFVRLASRWDGVAENWVPHTYIYRTEDQAASLVSPISGQTIETKDYLFKWTAPQGATQYALGIGTIPLSSDIRLGYGNILYATNLTAPQLTVTDIPQEGQKIYVRLWSYINNSWSAKDYILHMTNGQNMMPAPGTTLTPSTVRFSWNKGERVTRWNLAVGTNPLQLANPPYGDIFQSDAMTNNFADVIIPGNVDKVYVRIWTEIGGVWSFTDYSYPVQRAP